MVTPRDTLKDLLHFSRHLMHLIVECHTNFSSSETRMRYQQVQSGCYLLLTWSSQNNIINIVDQCDSVEETCDRDHFQQSYDTGWRVNTLLR